MTPPAECTVTLKRTVSIECSGQNFPWVVSNVQIVDGTEYVALQRRSGFPRFVSGSWQAARALRWTFLQELMKTRTQATLDAMSQTADCPFGTIDVTSAAKKRARKDAKTQAKCGQMPETVTVALPRITLENDTYLGPISFKMRSSIDIRDAPVVELDAHVLHYIKVGMMMAENSDDANHGKGNSKGEGVRWRTARNCWVAVREHAKYKHFKPADLNDEVAVQEARDKAARWAAGEDVDGGVVLDEPTEVGALMFSTGGDGEDTGDEASTLGGPEAVPLEAPVQHDADVDE